MTTPDVLVRVENLTVEFSGGGLFARKRSVVRAVADATLEVHCGEAVALVGESGSGKTTLGRCVLGQQAPTSGSVTLNGMNVATMDRTVFRKTVQAVFQNPIASLNPAMSVLDILTEPLRRLKGISDRDEIEGRCEALLDQVRLSHDVLDRRPGSLSGGMAQRVSIARALAPEPSLIVLDEAVSALDVATQAQVINLLADLRDETGVSYLFIAHDLALVRHLCDQIAVMRLGEIVERGPGRLLSSDPTHEYTRNLLDAVPVPDPRIRRLRTRDVTASAPTASVPGAST